MQYGDYGAFVWRGIDGSSIFVYENALGKLPVEHVGVFYGWGVLEGYDEDYAKFCAGELCPDIEGGVQAIFKVLDELPGEPVPVMLSGETHLPNSDVVSAILKGAGEHSARFATQSEYIDALRGAPLPMLSGEFNPEFTGCYSSNMRVKQLSRCIEGRLLTSEMLSSLSALHGAAPQSMHDLWERLALVQFHDSMGGCVDDASLEFISGEFDKLISESAYAQSAALDTLAEKCDTQGPGSEAWVVFNPSAHRHDEYVHLPVSPDMIPVDAYGRPYPAQAEEDGVLVRMPLSPTAVFVCWMKPGSPDAVTIEDEPEHVSFSTGRYNISATRDVLLVHDNRLHQQLFTTRPHLLLLHDKGTLWCEDYIGNERVLLPKLTAYEEGDLTHRLIYHGEIIGGLWEGFDSLAYRMDLVFYKDSARIDVDVSLDWAGKDTKVVLKLPVNYPAHKWTARHSIPFGSIERPDYGSGRKTLGDDHTVFGAGDEGFARGDWPALHWVDVRWGELGFALCNAGTPAHRVSDDGIEVGLLRSGTGHALPCFPVVPGQMSFENGKREFEFTLLPHAGEIDLAALDSELFMRPVAVRTGIHTGLPCSRMQFLESLPGNVALSSIKPAESGSGFVLRVYEVAGKPVEFKLNAAFPAHSVYRCNLEEERLESVESIKLGAYEICTLEIEPEADDTMRIGGDRS